MLGDQDTIPVGALLGEKLGSASSRVLLREWNNGIYDEHPEIIEYIKRNESVLADEADGIDRKHSNVRGRLKRYRT
jgi:hypothetical protein